MTRLNLSAGWIAAIMLSAFALAAEDSDKLARGKYLVEEVAKCQECHTPAGEDGKLDRSKWMKGTTLNVQPIGTIQGWHKNSPDLTPAGKLWGRWGEAGLLKYLQTGVSPNNGKAAGPPMPAYTLTTGDAEAVVAYLKSLK